MKVQQKAPLQSACRAKKMAGRCLPEKGPVLYGRTAGPEEMGMEHDMLRRFGCALCALAFALTALPTAAFAQQPEEQAAVQQSLSATDVREMQQADAAVTALTGGSDYAQMTEDERTDAALQQLDALTAQGLVSEKSRVLFVNDGSKDKTWELIQSFAAQDEHYIGISQSRNRGHQNAVLAGLMEALHSDSCDITISIDCDGQDDINAMDEMVKKYLDGAEVVYGVRSRRDTDTFFKRFTAEGFYHVMNALGADIVFNHADYRLISTRVLESFADYKEVNIFLRGMVPLVGFAHDVVTYERHERLAGESHYPLSKMLALAFDGITSLSNKPIRIITGAGIVVSLVSFIGVIWAIVCAAMGSSVAGWASTVCIVCFMGGVQLVCLGVIGEYIGKIYMETKARPRYIISERTWAPYERKYHG